MTYTRTYTETLDYYQNIDSIKNAKAVFVRFHIPGIYIALVIYRAHIPSLNLRSDSPGLSPGMSALLALFDRKCLINSVHGSSLETWWH